MIVHITIKTTDRSFDPFIPTYLKELANALEDPATQDLERMDGSFTINKLSYSAEVEIEEN